MQANDGVMDSEKLSIIASQIQQPHLNLI